MRECVNVSARFPIELNNAGSMRRGLKAHAWLCLLQLAVWAIGPATALADPVAEVGPEDVPAENRFDTARMNSSLVVPHTELKRFRYAVIDAHSHDSYAKTPEEVRAWVELQKKLNVAQTFIFTGKSGEDFAPRWPAIRGPIRGGL